ncbi:unnamed protein product [Didymodactylos carnosus]|uniref:Uncharacterized protein n=1 Tax=Didymodactylos carnosus TaxID=1234261 RepID=A0A815U6H5_9BILA|nr:unnamed protein product [Didymodactylos carnosus]CAF4372630.1 unnamed protein product [Didymodactylos carnosus]
MSFHFVWSVPESKRSNVAGNTANSHGLLFSNIIWIVGNKQVPKGKYPWSIKVVSRNQESSFSIAIALSQTLSNKIKSDKEQGWALTHNWESGHTDTYSEKIRTVKEHDVIEVC